MCLAIVLKDGAILPKDAAEEGYRSNSHGAGFAYLYNNEIKIRKGFFSFDDFWKHFHQIQQEFTGPKLVHFRLATSGTHSEYNCHPWEIDKGLVLIHNGIFPKYSFDDSIISDTGLFIEQELKPLLDICNRDRALLFKPEFREFFEGEIGSYNRIALLADDGSFCIYNEDEGHWQNDIWYSNRSYVPFTRFRRRKWSGVRGSKKSRKSTHYRLVGHGENLTPQEINALTKHHHAKIRQLVEKRVVEKVIVYDYTVSNEKKREEYRQWWQTQVD